MTAKTAVLYSGGLDSAILTAHLLEQGVAVQPIQVACGLYWEEVELGWARRFLDALEQRNLSPLVLLSMPLDDLYQGHWSLTGSRVPTSREADEAVYLPGRNPLLLVKAVVWCHLHGVPRLALGALGSNPFADATDEFFRDFSAAMDRALSANVRIVRPFAGMSKLEVMRLGQRAPLELTFSCIDPQGESHCGRCNKCAERQHAFRDAKMIDPTSYTVIPR